MIIYDNGYKIEVDTECDEEKETLDVTIYEILYNLDGVVEEFMHCFYDLTWNLVTEVGGDFDEILICDSSYIDFAGSEVSSHHTRKHVDRLIEKYEIESHALNNIHIKVF
jgi:hypothetical protein